MNKNIIIIGSNSKFAQKFLENNDLKKKYSKIFLISHRKYSGKTSNYNIIDNINPLHIIDIIEDILKSIKNNITFDVLITNTPPKEADYTSNLVTEWGIASFKIMHFLSYSPKINLAIFLGSCLSFIPIFRNGMYKLIKKNEFTFYSDLGFKMSKKISFCILPPLYPGTNGIGRLLSQSMSYWTKRILKEFSSDAKLILPKGFIGIIVKIILIFKFILT